MQAKGLWRACYGPFIADHLPGGSKTAVAPLVKLITLNMIASHHLEGFTQ
jgi:hypothetical protein